MQQFQTTFASMKRYQVYDEELAQEISRKHNVPASTVRSWKHRNRIPKKYSLVTDVDGELNPICTKETIIKVSKYLQKQTVLKGAGFKFSRFTTLKWAKTTMTINEYDLFCSEIKEVEALLQKIIDFKLPKSKQEQEIKKMGKELRYERRLNFKKVMELGGTGYLKAYQYFYGSSKNSSYKTHYKILIKGCKAAVKEIKLS